MKLVKPTVDWFYRKVVSRLLEYVHQKLAARTERLEKERKAREERQAYRKWLRRAIENALHDDN